MSPSLLLLFSFISTAQAIRIPTQIGEWTDYIASLPNGQLPHIPMSGNGKLGVMYDSHKLGSAFSSSTSSSSAGVGPGRGNTLDIWIGSNSMWSCANCSGTVAKGCCRAVSLGGMSVSLLPTFPTTPLHFNATQSIAFPMLGSNFITANGGVFTTSTFIHPTSNVVSTNVTWLPGPNDPSTLTLNVSVWVIGSTSSGAIPVPASVGCLSTTSPSTSPTPSLCSPTTPFSSQLLFASRRAASTPGTPLPIWAGLSLNISGNVSVAAVAITSNADVKDVWEVAATLSVPSGGSVIFTLAEAEVNTAGASDPALAAAALLTSGTYTLSDVINASKTWWTTYWSQSSVYFPSLPEVESLWNGAQYALGCTSSEDSVNSVGPGLYGVWDTSDNSYWAGDATLDYNYEAVYFGAFSSNHPAQVNSYYSNILDWMQPALVLGTTNAQAANITCPAQTLHYSCHLAPWGYQSFDESVYMHWNGNYAASAFINAWEYTLNASFASTVTYPLLDGLNAWWSCYLNLTNATTPSTASYGATETESKVYHDNRRLNPDAEHEGQLVSDPQIALAFIARGMWAQLNIGNALGLAVPSYVSDILTYLAPFNTAPFNWTNPPTNVNYTVWNDTRCTNDSGFIGGNTLEECEESCSKLETCAIFTFCPDRSVSGCDVGPSCWQYAAAENSTCRPQVGFTSGRKEGNPVPPTPETLTVWSAFADANVQQSDSFALYPLWPTEFLVSLPGTLDLATAETALASCAAYVSWQGGRTVDVFSSAVMAGYSYLAAAAAAAAGGAGAGGNASQQLPGYALTPEDIIAGFNVQIGEYWGANQLLYAPGGGIENIGISRAINEMLVVSIGGMNGSYIKVFPFWPASEPAEFETLLVKGGFLVSAKYDNVSMSVLSPVIITAQYGLFEGGRKEYSGATSALRLYNPWPSVTNPAQVSVLCEDQSSPTLSFNATSLILSYAAPAQVACNISLV